MQHLRTSPVKPKRVVVLGGSGFVGTDLVQHLKHLNIETISLSSMDVDLSEGRSVAALRRIVSERDTMVIISALTPDRGKDVGTLIRNLKMGEHLSAFLEGATCAHIVYVSSDAVYSEDANPVRETTCCSPATFHGIMHLVRERMLAAVAQKQGIALAVVRPCALYGADDTHNSYGPNRFLRISAAEGRIALFGNGEEIRDHLYIGDLSRVIGLCLAYRSKGVLNVATGKAVSFFELAQMICELRKNDVLIERLPRVTPITHRHFDIGALLRAFPLFRPTSLRTGLTETLNRMAGASSGRN